MARTRKTSKEALEEKIKKLFPILTRKRESHYE